MALCGYGASVRQKNQSHQEQDYDYDHYPSNLSLNIVLLFGCTAEQASQNRFNQAPKHHCLSSFETHRVDLSAFAIFNVWSVRSSFKNVRKKHDPRLIRQNGLVYMIENFVIASIPFICAGTILTFIQLRRGTYRFTLTKRLLLVLVGCAICTIPMGCMVWDQGFCEALPFQVELFFVGYVGSSLLLICVPTLGGYLVGQVLAAFAHSIKARVG